jgi:hypothetical protein
MESQSQIQANLQTPHIKRKNPSLQKSQFSHPPHHDNDRMYYEKSYLDRLN